MKHTSAVCTQVTQPPMRVFDFVALSSTPLHPSPGSLQLFVLTDVLFGLVKQIMKRRHDLKVIVMSATLQAESFSSFFNE